MRLKSVRHFHAAYLFAVLFVFVQFSCTQRAIAQYDYWNASDGDWFAPSSWRNNVVPTGGAIYVENGGTAHLAGDAGTFSTIRVNYSTLNITGTGSLTLSGYLQIGMSTMDGGGTVNVLDGGTLISNSGISSIGRDVTNGDYGTGYLNVSGSGSSASFYELNVGFFYAYSYSGYPAGYVTVTEGAALNVSTDLLIGSRNTGYGVYGYGEMTVSNSEISVGGSTTVGNYGTGWMVVSHSDFDSGAIAVATGPFGVGRLDIEASNVNTSTIDASATTATGAATLNILGGKSDIELTGNFNDSGKLNTYFYVDSDTTRGISAIDTGGTVNLDGDHLVCGYGLAAQQSTNTFDLFTAPAGAYTGTFSAPEMEILDDGAVSGTFTVGFDADQHPVWDIYESLIFTPSNARAYDGWVKLENATGITDVIAKFADGGGAITADVYDAFINYLNNGMSATGLSLESLEYDANSVTVAISPDIFNGGAYDMLGWGLNHFNELHGTGIYLESFSTDIIPTPEPATWVMMLLGIAGMAAGYRRKFKAERK